jgi:hypothetical protein
VHVIVLETLQQLLLAVEHRQPRCADDVRGHRPSTSSFSDGALLVACDDVLTVLGDVFQSRRSLRYEVVVVVVVVVVAVAVVVVAAAALGCCGRHVAETTAAFHASHASIAILSTHQRPHTLPLSSAPTCALGAAPPRGMTRPPAARPGAPSRRQAQREIPPSLSPSLDATSFRLSTPATKRRAAAGCLCRRDIINGLGLGLGGLSWCNTTARLSSLVYVLYHNLLIETEHTGAMGTYRGRQDTGEGAMQAMETVRRTRGLELLSRHTRIRSVLTQVLRQQLHPHDDPTNPCITHRSPSTCHQPLCLSSAPCADRRGHLPSFRSATTSCNCGTTP